MEEVKSLNSLKGSFINLEYKLPSGQTVKLWDDEKIYLGNQICKKNSNRCYGLAADENYLSVAEIIHRNKSILKIRLGDEDIFLDNLWGGGADIFLDYFMLLIQDYVCTLPGSYSPVTA